jgi:hypothetical protein
MPVRWNKLPKRGLQLRLTLVFVTIAGLASLFQVFLINRALLELAQSLPHDGQIVVDQLPEIFEWNVLWTLLTLVPSLVVVGVLVTSRVAGPAHRLERYLLDVADGQATGPCTIRARDELQELCDAVNHAVESLRARAPAESAREPAPVGSSHGGFAIVTALVTVFILMAVILTAVTQFRSHSSRVEQRGEDYELESAVESAGDAAMHALWSEFRARVSSRTHTDDVEGFRAYLDSIGCREEADGDGGAAFDLAPRLALAADEDGNPVFSNVRIEALTVTRRDLDESTDLTISTTAASHARRTDGKYTGWKRAVETTFALEPETWGGLEYVLLANNVNCILCHMKADSTSRAFRTRPGPHPRVKIGTLEQLSMRDWANSAICGTLHAAGPVTDEFGTPITDWRRFTLRTARLDGDGNVVEDAAGNAITQVIDPADGSTDAFGGLYEDYASTAMIDGELPGAFPPPFPDDGGVDSSTGTRTTAGAGNRTVDAGEFHAVTRGFRGSLSGGRIHVVPRGSRIATTSDLTVAMRDSSTAFLPAVTEGHVFLTGTQDEPILLNGDVAIDGNLVMRGWVKGKGTIWVRDNVYAPVDIRYLDGVDARRARTFGRAADGSQNLLAVTAGGNVLIGDPFAPYRVGTSREGVKPSFAAMEMSIFNRAEWVRTQPQLPGARGPIANPLYDAHHVPRYYAMSVSDSVGIFNKGGGYFDSTGTWRGAEHPDAWSSTLMTLGNPRNAADPLLYDATGAPKARVTYLKAADGWISDAQLARLMDEAYAGRPEGRLEIDLFAYTNNAIFGIASTMGRRTLGKLRINGGVVAADVGLLAVAGVELNYDARVLDVLRIAGAERVAVRRTGSRVLH